MVTRILYPNKAWLISKMYSELLDGSFKPLHIPVACQMPRLFLRVEHDQVLLLEHPIPYVLLKAINNILKVIRNYSRIDVDKINFKQCTFFKNVCKGQM